MSHDRAITAGKNGLLDDEMVPAEVPQRKGRPATRQQGRARPPRRHRGVAGQVAADLRPRKRGGTVTTGPASQISAAAVVHHERGQGQTARCPRAHRARRARCRGRPGPVVAVPASHAIAEARGREGLTPAQVDLFKINEAFASIVIQSMRDLDIGSVVVNVNGGAIAMGHRQHPAPARTNQRNLHNVSRICPMPSSSRLSVSVNRFSSSRIRRCSSRELSSQARFDGIITPFRSKSRRHRRKEQRSDGHRSHHADQDATDDDRSDGQWAARCRWPLLRVLAHTLPCISAPVVAPSIATDDALLRRSVGGVN